jgi:hypothetical protein
MQGAVDKIQAFMSDLVGNVKPTAVRVAKSASATAQRVVKKTRTAATSKKAKAKTKRVIARKSKSKARSVKKARR